MTAGDIATMGRNGLNPVIFMLNYAGYMVERAFEKNPDWVYNDLAPWSYHALPAALGCRGCFTAKFGTLSIVKYGRPSRPPTWYTCTMLACHRPAAASASRRKRSRSSSRAKSPAESISRATGRWRD